MTRADTAQGWESMETRAWIVVILSLLLAEVGMHELDRLTPGWIAALTAVLLAAVLLAGWMGARRRGPAWLIVIPLLGMIGGSVLANALGLSLLRTLDLSGLVILGTQGPDHGLLGLGHLLADLTVVGIGVHQLVRWRRMRSSGAALGAAAAFTACCGTTAVLLAPVFAGLGGLLGLAGFHVVDSAIVLAAVTTAVVAALGFALAGGRRLETAADSRRTS